MEKAVCSATVFIALSVSALVLAAEPAKVYSPSEEMVKKDAAARERYQKKEQKLKDQQAASEQKMKDKQTQAQEKMDQKHQQFKSQDDKANEGMKKKKAQMRAKQNMMDQMKREGHKEIEPIKNIK